VSSPLPRRSPAPQPLWYKDAIIRRIVLMNGILMSMPGSAIIYYGDEIGMGDNIYLGDGNGVRTPMQWSGGWNAGFSSTDPERLAVELDLQSLAGALPTKCSGAACSLASENCRTC
jgi:glycosidase